MTKNDEYHNNLIRTCKSCGQLFIFRRDEQEHFRQMGWTTPLYCPDCRKERQKQRQAAEDEKDNVKWAAVKQKEQEEFKKEISGIKAELIENIRVSGEHTLYIIGNGFDLMHGVKSSYYAFRDSLGKNSRLRPTLEYLMQAKDLWGDFEATLASLNVGAMADKNVVDMWLYDYDAYSQESAADYYMAIGAAADPIINIVNDLQRRFRA